MKFKYVLVLIAALVFAFTFTPYAHAFSGYNNESIKIKAAPPADTAGMTILGGAVCSVTPGDLFYIENADPEREIRAYLYLTNASELTSCLRNLILVTNVYVESPEDNWQKIADEPAGILTLQNSPTNFILSGYSRYKISVDSGSYSCWPFNTRQSACAPNLYLTIES